MQYKNRPGVAFYAVNMAMPWDTRGEAMMMLQKRNYRFPMLVAKDESVSRLFKVFTVPTVIILHNGNEIIYRGNIEGIDRILP